MSLATAAELFYRIQDPADFVDQVELESGLEALQAAVNRATYRLASKTAPDGAIQAGLDAEFADELEGDCVVFRFVTSDGAPDIGRKSSRSGFVAHAGPLAVLLDYIESHEATAFHEVIRAGKPRKLMFDVDGINAPLDAIPGYVEVLAAAVSRCLIDMEFEYAELNPATYTVCVSDEELCKGFHIVFSGIPQMQARTIRKIYEAVRKDLGAQSGELAKALMAPGVIDNKPATDSFNMRLMGSFKVKEDGGKRVLDPNRQKAPVQARPASVEDESQAPLASVEDVDQRVAYFRAMLVQPPRHSCHFNTGYEEEEEEHEAPTTPTATSDELRAILDLSFHFKTWRLGSISRVGYMLVPPDAAGPCHDCTVCKRRHDKSHVMLVGRGLRSPGANVQFICLQAPPGKRTIETVKRRRGPTAPVLPTPPPPIRDCVYKFNVEGLFGTFRACESKLRRHCSAQVREHVAQGSKQLKEARDLQLAVEPVPEPESDFVIPKPVKRGKAKLAPPCDKNTERLAKERAAEAQRKQKAADRAYREALVDMKLAVAVDLDAHIQYWIASEKYERDLRSYHIDMEKYEKGESPDREPFDGLMEAIEKVRVSGVRMADYAGLDFQDLHQRTYDTAEDLVRAIHATLRVSSQAAHIVYRGAWVPYDFLHSLTREKREKYVFKITGTSVAYTGAPFWKAILDVYFTDYQDRFEPYPASHELKSTLGEPLNTFTGLRGTGLIGLTNPGLAAEHIRAFLDLIECQLATEGPEYSEYLLNWLAWVIQRPQSKTGVAVLIHGAPGTGKSMLFSLLNAIVPHAGLCTNTGLTTLTNRFNSDLDGKVLYMVGELGERLTEDPAITATLKALITDDTIVIEHKGKDVRVVPQYLNILAASNNVNCIQTSVGDRRWCMMYNPNPVHVFGDTEYFTTMWNLVYTPAFGANIQQFLATRDITRFAPQDYPRSFALRATKLSASPILDFALHTSTLQDMLDAHIGEAKRPYCLRDVVLVYEAQESPRFPNYQRLENELYNALMNCAQLRERFIMHPEAIDDRLIFDGRQITNPIQFLAQATQEATSKTTPADAAVIAQMIAQLKALGADTSAYELAFPVAAPSNYAIQKLAWLQAECKTRELGSTRNLSRARLIEMLKADDAKKAQ